MRAASTITKVVLTNALLIALVILCFEAALLVAHSGRHSLGENKYRDDWVHVFPAGQDAPGETILMKTPLITWGIPVRINQLGFRERDFPEEKAPGTRRVMVVGDSLVFGVGLSEEQRFTNLAEHQLAAAAPEEKWEVLNFGIYGAPATYLSTVTEAILPRVKPDLLVLTFCFNDPSPVDVSYNPEQAEFEQRHHLLFSAATRVKELGLRNLAAVVRESILSLGLHLHRFPSPLERMDRSYRPDSENWRQFELSLARIAAAAASQKIPVLFFPLHHAVAPGRPLNLTNPDADAARMLRWISQAEDSARRQGMAILDGRAEIAGRFDGKDVSINSIDGHPSAEINVAYAKLLSSWILRNSIK